MVRGYRPRRVRVAPASLSEAQDVWGLRSHEGVKAAAIKDYKEQVVFHTCTVVVVAVTRSYTSIPITLLATSPEDIEISAKNSSQ